MEAPIIRRAKVTSKLAVFDDFIIINCYKLFILSDSTSK